LHNINNSTVEYCQMYDNLADNNVHANVCDTEQSSYINFRYNNIYHWQSEGIMMTGTSTDLPCDHWYIYGNVWHDGYPGPSVARVLTCQNITDGPVYFYNNTIANTFEGVLPEGGSFLSTPPSQGRNNIYYNLWGGGSTSATEGLGDDDYDFSDRAGTQGQIQNNFGYGAHDVPNGSYPFVGTSDYHIVGTSGSYYPLDKGVALSASYSKDMDGYFQGSDCDINHPWDIGAYSYHAQ
jgi:hypothetical protein